MSQNKNTYWISLSSDLLSSLASFQCSLFPTGIFPVTWAYPNVNQHFSSKSWLECPSVCPVLFRFQHEVTPFIPCILAQIGDVSFITSGKCVRSQFMEPKCIFDCEGIAPGSSLNTIIPKTQWRI